MFLLIAVDVRCVYGAPLHWLLVCRQQIASRAFSTVILPKGKNARQSFQTWRQLMFVWRGCPNTQRASRIPVGLWGGGLLGSRHHLFGAETSILPPSVSPFSFIVLCLFPFLEAQPLKPDRRSGERIARPPNGFGASWGDNRALVIGDSAVSKSFYRRRHANLENIKMTWIHQLCNLQANYTSHKVDQNCGHRAPQPEFLGVRTPRHRQWLSHCCKHILTYTHRWKTGIVFCLEKRCSVAERMEEVTRIISVSLLEIKWEIFRGRKLRDGYIGPLLQTWIFDDC